MAEVIEEYRALQARIRRAIESECADGEFETLALGVHQFQRRWNEPYARFCGQRPEPTHWAEIPAVPQGVFKRFTLSCVPSALITRTFLTSGTTSETRGVHAFADTELYDCAAAAGWKRLGLPRHPQLILAPHPAHAPSSSLSHMLEHFATFSDSPQIWALDGEGKMQLGLVRQTLEHAAREGRPLALLGTALSFLYWFEHGPSVDLSVTGSFAMETGGYKGTGRQLAKCDLYALFRTKFGLGADAVVNEYGMTELSSQFYTGGLGRPHTAGPWVRARVLDPVEGGEVALGEVGVLTLYDLANLNSVLAVRTQDLAVRRDEGFELIGRDPTALPRGCSRAVDETLRA